jgi:hypothetical protein
MSFDHQDIASTNTTTGVNDNTPKISLGPIERLKEFMWFPKLPLEIRNQIWREACFESRAVDIWVAGIRSDKI